MSHSFACLYVHVVFSTFEREKVLTPQSLLGLRAYSAGILQKEGGKLFNLNGHLDHVHLLASFPLSKAPSNVVRAIKANSSRWMKSEQELPNFGWQTGYSLISLSPDRRVQVSGYIDKQEVHHRHKSFDEELRRFRVEAGLPETPLEGHGFMYEDGYFEKR